MSFVKSTVLQVVMGLNLLQKLNIVHCDLKPENILMTTAKKEETRVKIIDLGSSSFVGSPVYSYVQSRYYRAPEVTLGCPNYNQQVDMFSMGCIVAELYTGYPLFPANDECELLEFQTAILGAIPHYMIEDSQKFNQFFSID
jgi:dual specificity tyrosine-phosphorylation-regulated kinase 2/3/4